MGWSLFKGGIAGDWEAGRREAGLSTGQEQRVQQVEKHFIHPLHQLVFEGLVGQRPGISSLDVV